MKPISECMEATREILRRCAERAEDPVFQENARRLEVENAEAAEVARESARKMELHSAGVPYGFWNVIREPKETPALHAVRDFLAAPKECCYAVLVGPVGNGKSTALGWACSMARGSRFVKAADLVFAGAFDPVWKDLLNAPLLALDELGAEHVNDSYLASLYNLLEGRGAWQRKTLIAGNLGAAGFAKRYCARQADIEKDPLYDRITKYGKWTGLDGESLRKHWSEAVEERES